MGRLQWICPVRSDLCYAVKELARSVANPTIADLTRMKHVLLYIKGSKKWRLCLKRAPMDIPILKAYADSDWAGCVKTRKSTSGYIVKLGANAISFGFKTQASLALSSGEAELYALCSATVEALHIRKVLEETFQIKSEIEVFTDSTAGKFMANRFGTSRRMRHIDLRFLWIQSLIDQKLIKVSKVPGSENPADLFTKFVSTEVLQFLRKHISMDNGRT